MQSQLLSDNNFAEINIEPESILLFNCFILNHNDTVGILLDASVREGDVVHYHHAEEALSLIARQCIPTGHKIAISKMAKGDPIIKYGMPIGYASEDILLGDHVHLHNLKYNADVLFKSNLGHKNSIPNLIPSELDQYFSGYKRDDGRIGVRNYLVLIALSNCAATVVKKIARYFEDKELPQGIDGVVPVTYNGGCALAEKGPYFDLLNRTLSGWINHPNVVSAVVVGLGCETIGFNTLLNYISPNAPVLKGPLLKHFNIQDSGGMQGAVQRGICTVRDQLLALPRYIRTQLDVSGLNIALNCGGSDYLSGLTANPALGLVGDWIVQQGGTVVLAEMPECNGAEDLLYQRCLFKKDKNKLKKILEYWTNYVHYHQVNMNNNLSTGNKEGGLTTILEKSLGAIAKGGTSPIQQVLEYAEKCTKKGLLLMDTPGFDPVSMTGLIAGGSNIGVFTTGRGSLYGCAIAPVIKLSTNSYLLAKFSDVIDTDAGKTLRGVSLSDFGKELYKMVIDVASGYKTKSEINKVGFEEFIPWHTGETL